ncbi:nucleosome assembly protein [Medicago truncatula]|uniref:Nucleosome assembly protein n=1 Tax=Medicago truncatula TaxID=3880 RepID=G7JGI5_MEDTR|nr:nucleosome assembly protein [Medicago truncatula]
MGQREYLSSLDIRANKDIKSANTTFTLNFNPNPYFEDSLLSKTFAYLREGTTKDYPIRWKEGNITATPIRWKEGKGIPNIIDHEEKGNKQAPVGVRTAVFAQWSLSDNEGLVKKIISAGEEPGTYLGNIIRCFHVK